MNINSLPRWRIALFGLGAATLVLSALLGGKHEWLSLLSFALFLCWAISLILHPSAPTALRRPPPPRWSDTIPTQPAALEGQRPSRRPMAVLLADRVLSPDEVQRMALSDAQKQLKVAIGHLVRATEEPASVEDLAAARAWLRQIGAI